MIFYLLGCHIVQVRLILQPAGFQNAPILVYGDFFKFSNHFVTNDENGNQFFGPQPGIDMFLLERHRRSDGTRVSDVFRLENIQGVADLVPRFGRKIDNRFNANTSLNGDDNLRFNDHFYLNNFATKETFHAILSYQ